jgi:NAD(P)H-dependent FMN reductase
MRTPPLRVAVIVGSTREGRFGGTVADWFVGRAGRRDDLVLDVIDLVDVELPIALPSVSAPPVAAFVERIGQADAFVVITPEYNHGYPAALKQAIDLPRDEWREKPVGFVSYGGVSGGLRAVEQLRQVFAELHVVTMRDSVSFAMAWDHFDESGQLLDPKASNRSASTMLDQLAWWATALRAAHLADAATFEAPEMSVA